MQLAVPQHLPASVLPPVQKYEHLMQANEKNGSFYLQSKVYRCDWQGAQCGGCMQSDCCSRRRCPLFG